MLNEEMPISRVVVIPITHCVWLNLFKGQSTASQPTMSACEDSNKETITRASDAPIENDDVRNMFSTIVN